MTRLVKSSSRDFLVAEIELAKQVAVFPVITVDQLDQEQLGVFIFEQRKNLGNQNIIALFADGFGTFDDLADDV